MVMHSIGVLLYLTRPASLAGQLEAGGGAEEAKLLREQIHQLTPAPWEGDLITKLISSGSQPAEI